MKVNFLRISTVLGDCVPTDTNAITKMVSFLHFPSLW